MNTLELTNTRFEEWFPSDRVTAPIRANKKRVYSFVKRSFDLVASASLGLLLLIPSFIIAAMIRLDSKGPALFLQKRMGQDGRTFTIYKFRTMRVDAPHDLATRDFTNSDQYMSKLGSFLRRTSLDEIPQLLNILFGQMSFVGYRPVCLTEIKLNELRAEYGVFAAKPGLTGLAQVLGRDNVTFEEKALIDRHYIMNRSIRMDLYCLFKTVQVVFTGEGVK